MGRRAQIVPVTQRVTVKASPHYDAIPNSEWKYEFPVLVQVAPLKASVASTTPVDFVVVLDIGPSMTKEMLENVKKAMEDVVKGLGQEDRFSIVSFSSKAHHCTQLMTKMSGEGLEEAFSRFNTMVGLGESDIPEALQQAAKVFKARKCDESIDRNSFIVLFSAGEDDSIYTKPIRDDIPVYTFGLGKYHDPRMMFHIAENTCGTYSFIHKDMEKMGSALGKIIQKEKSVMATNIVIPFCTKGEVEISSISSGGHKNDIIDKKKQSGVVKINRLYAREEIKFMVFLDVPEGGDQTILEKMGFSDKKMKLMTVGITNEGILHVDKPVDVRVIRTPDGTPSKKLCPLVAHELKRLELVRGISDLAKKPTAEGFQTIWNEFIKSGGDHLVSKWKLDEDIWEMQKGISDANTHKMHGLPYMLSWLSSHNWQRATAKGSPYIPDNFLPTSTLEQHTTPYIPNSFLPTSIMEQHTMCPATLQLLPCAISALVILLLAVLFGFCTGIVKPLWPALQLVMESSTVVTVMNRAIQQYLYSAVTYSIIILGAFATFVSEEVVSVEQKARKLVVKGNDEDMKILKQTGLVSECASDIAAYAKACGGRAGMSTVQISEMDGSLAVAT